MIRNDKAFASSAGIPPPRFLRRLSLLLLALPVLAPTRAQETTLAHEYGRVIQSAEVVGNLGPDAFGEQTNLYTGSTEFTVTDIELPGPGLVPVRLGRRYVVENKIDADEQPIYPFADWQIDIPHVHGTFARQTGWSSPPSGNRCSNVMLTEPPTVYYLGQPFSGADYWYGHHLYAPGAGEQELLVYQQSSNPNQPASGGPYYWVTQDQWFFSCLSTLANGNGYSGQGFLAIDPNGTRYTFDWMVPYRTQLLSKPLGMPPLRATPSMPGTEDSKDLVPTAPGMAILPRDDVWIYPTRIEDRFGNFVAFTWYGAKLMQIAASDGRSITLTYDNDVIASATDGTRTWNYQYDAARDFLLSATRPDGSAWGYQMADLVWLYPMTLEDRGCGGELLRDNAQTSHHATITHPSGATGMFTFRPTQHGRASVPQICAPYLNQNNGTSYYTVHPRYFSSFALKTKTISGPGLAAPLTWQFDYGTANATWQGECGSGCITTKAVAVTGPDDFVRHTFGTKYAENEGRLLKRETGPNINTILRTETMTHQTSSAGLAFPSHVGFSPMQRTDGMAGRNIPQKGNTITQDGNTFGWSVAPADFDIFARPTRITRTGSATRVEKIAYHDNTARWVLGQMEKRTCLSTTAGGTGCTNTAVAQTTFDPVTALPLTHAAYGQVLQTLTWHADGSLHTSTDGNGHTTTFTDWYRGVPRHIRHPATAEAPAGATQTAIVSARGEITRITDELGYATNYGYDPMGRLSSITWPAGDSTAWTPTSRSFAPLASDDTDAGIPAGRWRLAETTGTHSRDTFYDALWRPVLTRERDTASSATTRYVKRAFDSQGRETFASYPSTGSSPATGITTQYDALGRTRKTQANSELGILTTEISYLPGNQVAVIDPRGHVTTTSHQTFDEPDYRLPLSVAAPEGVTTTYTRDAYGKPLTLTRSGSYTPPGGGPESLSLTRRYLYDSQQRLCKTIEPDAGISLFLYDAAGNLAWRATGQNTLTSTTSCQTGSVGPSKRSAHVHDARNRLIAIDHPGSTEDVGFTYHPDGALHTATTGTLSATAPLAWSSRTSEWTYGYNKRRLPTTESLHLPPENRTFALTHGYTALGHDASLTYPDTAPGTALSIAYAPNALGQPTQAGSHAISAMYHPNGQIKGFSYGNGLARSVTQNARGLPGRILDQYSGGKRLDHTLTYDPNANLAGLVDGLDGAQESRTFQYDARDRLMTISATPTSGSYTETWAYDPLDRIRRVTQPGRDWRYHYDAGTFLLSEIRNPANAPQRSYAWSARGEWTTRTWHSAGNPGFTPPTIFRNGFEEDLISTSGTFTFDNAERLVSANGITHRYDAHGRRVLTIEPMWGTRYQVYDRRGALRYAEDSASNERTEYIHLNGQLVAERTRALNASAATVAYLHSDHRGTPSVKTASNRDVIYRSWNDAYGEPHDHLWRDGPGFTGHAMDPANQLVYMQQRYHDPETGFISPDPVAADHGSFNRYWYANNNPYTLVDPDGKFPQLLGAIITGAVIGATVDVVAQQFVNGLGSNIDTTSVYVSAGVGAATGGVGAIYANAARIGMIAGKPITTIQAVARTAGTNGAIGAAGSAVDSVAHGEAPSATSMAISGAATMGMSAAAGRISNATAIKLENISGAAVNTPAGIGGSVARSTASAQRAAASQSASASFAEFSVDVIGSAAQRKIEEKK